MKNARALLICGMLCACGGASDPMYPVTGGGAGGGSANGSGGGSANGSGGGSGGGSAGGSTVCTAEGEWQSSNGGVYPISMQARGSTQADAAYQALADCRSVITFDLGQFNQQNYDADPPVSAGITVECHVTQCL